MPGVVVHSYILGLRERSGYPFARQIGNRFHRSLKLPQNRSSILLGARGTGKSTLVREVLPVDSTLVYNQLEADLEDRLSRDPRALAREVLALRDRVAWVVVDEVQRVPRLLDVVHDLIERHQVPQRFVLTGSSARKLKAGGANLLAGRAFLRHLHPLTREELGSSFEIRQALAFGGLPEVWNLRDDEDRKDYLRAYALAYLQEEIRGEQVVRRLDPFRRFMEVAAQGDGKILNHASIARDVGADLKTVQGWFSVLEDTLVGFHLDAYRGSVRKRLRRAPKFFLFDGGAARAMARHLTLEPVPGTRYYGACFEGWVIREIHALNQIRPCGWDLTYLMTAQGLEIDLVIGRPGRPPALVEIKSTEQVREDHARALLAMAPAFPDADLLLFSRDRRPQRFGRVLALPWDEGLQAL